jgi:hypothetical protein
MTVHRVESKPCSHELDCHVLCMLTRPSAFAAEVQHHILQGESRVEKYISARVNIIVTAAAVDLRQPVSPTRSYVI